MKQGYIVLIIVIILLLVGMYFQYKFPIFSLLANGEYRANSDCSFITNVPSGDTYRQNGAWISLNTGSGMDGYGYAGYSTFSCTSSTAIMLSTKTIEGYDLCLREDYPTRVYLREGNFGLFFDSSNGGDAITSCDDGNGGGSGGDDCNTEADTNCDGFISSSELNTFINKYLSSQVSRNQIANVIQSWSK